MHATLGMLTFATSFCHRLSAVLVFCFYPPVFRFPHVPSRRMRCIDSAVAQALALDCLCCRGRCSGPSRRRCWRCGAATHVSMTLAYIVVISEAPTRLLQVFTCARLLLCIGDSDPVRCARLCPRMLRAVTMASKCAPGTSGQALLSRSSSQLQLLLQTLAANAPADAEEGSDREEGAFTRTPAPAVRKGAKRRRFRSRNSVLDDWLADDKARCFRCAVMCFGRVIVPTGGRRCL
jgi:hypothetical protein